MVRTGVLAAVCAALVLAPCSLPAQQLPGSATPPGITVFVTKTVTTDDIVELISGSIHLKSLAATSPESVKEAQAAIAGLRGRLGTLATVVDAGRGVDFRAKNAPTQNVTVRVLPAGYAAAESAMKDAGFEIEGIPIVAPRDPDALKNQALAAAVKAARAEADTIAAAGGGHIGHLINAQPSPLEIAQSVLQGSMLSAFAGIGGASKSGTSASATAGGYFTFSFSP